MTRTDFYNFYKIRRFMQQAKCGRCLSLRYGKVAYAKVTLRGYESIVVQFKEK
jgi:hypothetical protein